METKTLKYYMNLVDKAAAGFGRTDSNFFLFQFLKKFNYRVTESDTTKQLNNNYGCTAISATAYCREITHKGRVSQHAKHQRLLLRNCHSHQPSTTAPLLSQQIPTPRQLTEGSGDD